MRVNAFSHSSCCSSSCRALLALLFFLPIASLKANPLNLPELSSVTFYEQTSGQVTLTLSGATLGTGMTKLASLGSGSYDLKGSSAGEYYDIYWSTPDGHYDPNGNCVTIDCVFSLNDSAGNIDAVKLLYGSNAFYANSITRVIHGGPPNLFVLANDTKALGHEDGAATNLGATNQGTGAQNVPMLSMTLAFLNSFVSDNQLLAAPITPANQTTFGAGIGKITSMNVTSSGTFSFTNSALMPNLFGTGSNPIAPPDSALWGSDTARQLVNLGFDGQFTGLAGLSLTYDPSWIPAGYSAQDLVVYHYNGSSWDSLQTVVDSQTNTLSFETASFSPFVVGVVPEPGSIQLLCLGLFGACAILAKRRS